VRFGGSSVDATSASKKLCTLRLRKACERTIPRLSRRIGRIVADFSTKECRNFFRNGGYVRI
jgi:hypothetical protein